MTIGPEFVAGAETLPLKGAALVAAQRVDAMAKAPPFSTNRLERNIILGLIYTESWFDSAAIGDEGAHHGWFQMETGPGVPEKEQLEHAMTRIRAALEQFSDQKTGRFKPFLDVTPSGIIRFLKASWQVSERRLSEWMSAMVTSTESFYQMVATARRENTGLYAGKSDEEAVLMLFGGSILGPDNFVNWLGTKGANIEALQNGQRRITAFEEFYKWSPTGVIGGESRIPPDFIEGMGEQMGGAAREVAAGAFDMAGRAVAGAVGSFMGGISHGARQVLPYIGMAAAGYLLYKLWSSARRRQSEEA